MTDQPTFDENTEPADNTVEPDQSSPAEAHPISEHMLRALPLASIEAARELLNDTRDIRGDDEELPDGWYDSLKYCGAVHYLAPKRPQMPGLRPTVSAGYSGFSAMIALLNKGDEKPLNRLATARAFAGCDPVTLMRNKASAVENMRRLLGTDITEPQERTPTNSDDLAKILQVASKYGAINASTKKVGRVSFTPVIIDESHRPNETRPASDDTKNT